MKIRTIMKIAIISSIVLLCTGFVMYSFFKLSATQSRVDFNLYTLVPPTATGVLETDDAEQLMQDIDELNCSKDHHFLYISDLFSMLKQHLHSLQEETPHGLSRQMNTMLFSFHEPANKRNQVLYCSLGSGDFELVERFIRKCSSSAFPTKMFNYNGEDIRIYSMADGNFLACYVTSQFLVVSYQKRLIEKVIDARLSGKSLLNDASFEVAHAEKKSNATAVVYARMHSLNMGKMTDGIRTQASLGGWTEFDIKMKNDAIYFSGVSYDTDTCLTFMNMLRQQQPIEGFSKEILPVTTFFFSKRSVSDLQAMFDFTTHQEYATATYSGYIKARDEELLRYLTENGGKEIVTCLFQRVDTATTHPAAVMSLSMNEVDEAERLLKVLIQNSPSDEDVTLPLPVTLNHKSLKGSTVYLLPRNTLFTQLTGITDSALHIYASFYAGRLLLAPDEESLSLYINHLDKGEVINQTSIYSSGISGLADKYHFMLAADLSAVFAQPENYVRLVPSFFFQNADFFRYFTLAAQFTCSEGVVYPNVVLLYKGE